MKEKWSKGQLGGTVISDTSSFRNGGADSVEYYGGYLVAESISKSEHANLIAAAPDLLEALEECERELSKAVAIMPRRYCNREDNKRCEDLLAKVRAAVRKATEGP